MPTLPRLRRAECDAAIQVVEYRAVERHGFVLRRAGRSRRCFSDLRSRAVRAWVSCSNSTGTWTTWALQNVTVPLDDNATNTIRFESNGQDLANIDQLEVL
jgi:hypothetical protein